MDNEVSFYKDQEELLLKDKNYKTAWEMFTGPIDYEHDPKAPRVSPEVAAAYQHISERFNDTSIQSRANRIRISRFELNEAFSLLINSIYPIKKDLPTS